MKLKHCSILIIVIFFIFPPVTYSQSSAKADTAAQMISEVRLFTGKILSVNDVEVPIVVNVLEDVEGKILKLLVTYFVPEAISLFIDANQINYTDDKTTFSAVTKDPRGFNISWSAQIQNGQLTGVYFQPSDSGEIILHEVEQAITQD